MMFIYVYVASLIVGGILLGASLFLGHEGNDTDLAGDADVDVAADADVDVTADTDVDVAADADVDVAADADVHMGDLEVSDFWLPFISLRFWVFFLTFFGMTGSVLQLLGLAGAVLTLGVSLGVGVTTGFGAAFIVQRLKRSEVGLATKLSDYEGLDGRVLLPVSKESKGKVRVTLPSGQLVDLIAVTDEDSPLPKGSRAMVVEVRDGRANVISSPS